MLTAQELRKSVWRSHADSYAPGYPLQDLLTRAAGHSSTMLEWTMLETRSSLTLCHGSGAMQLVR